MERQVGSAALRFSYIGSRTTDLIYRRNLNQPRASLTPFSPSEYPYPNFTTIRWYANGGEDKYNGLQLDLASAFGSNVTYNVGYAYSKDTTNDQIAGNFSGPEIQNQYDLEAEWGPNEVTPTHNVFGYIVYQLPFGKGRRYLNKNHRFVQTFLGGWQLGVDGMAQSGEPFTPSFSGFDPSNTNTLGGRPDKVPGVSPKPVGGQSVNNWFNPKAFKIPGCPDNDPVCAHPANVGRFGNVGVNTLRGPMVSNLDLTLSKTFPIHGNLRLQLQGNSTDVINHPNFGLPHANISSPGTVGRITSQIAPGSGSKGREINIMALLQF